MQKNKKCKYTKIYNNNKNLKQCSIATRYTDIYNNKECKTDILNVYGTDTQRHRDTHRHRIHIK